MSNPTMTTDWIDQLLSLSEHSEQLEYLCTEDLLNSEGVSLLLDSSEPMIGRSPRAAQRLTALCAETAEQVDAPALVARAMYLQAQTYLIEGEFDAALAQIEIARTAYASLNMQVEALRTDVGRMNVLAELGQFQESLVLGQGALKEIEAADRSTDESPTALRQLEARIYVNLATTLERVGRYNESLSATEQAEALFESLDDREWLANMSNNRGLIYVYIGRVGDGLKAFERAIELRADDVSSLPHAHTLINVGEAHLLLGNYTQSLHAFEAARTLLAALDAPVDQQINLLHLARAYHSLNLYPEALVAYRDAQEKLTELELHHEKGLTLWGIGSTHIALGQYQKAESALSEADALFASVNNRPLRASILLEQAGLYAEQEKNAKALKVAYKALALLSSTESASPEQTDEEWPVQKVYAHLRIADLLLPDIAGAEVHLEQAEQHLSTLTLPQLRYRLNQRMGHLRLLEGRLTEAIPLLEDAIDEIERLRATVTHESLRTSFLHDKVAAYEDLVQLYLERGEYADIPKAFQVAERAKSRALVELVASAIGPAKTAAIDNLQAQQLDALQADLSAVYNELLQNEVDDDTQGDDQSNQRVVRTAHLQTRALKLEQQLGQLNLQVIVSGMNEEGMFLDPFMRPLSLSGLQAKLDSNKVVLSYYTIGTEVIGFIIDPNKIHVVRSLSSQARVQQLLEKLTVQWSRFQTGSAFVERHMMVLEQTAQQILMDLYEELLAPVETYLEAQIPNDCNLQHLTIVPHGFLHQVPFHALYNGEHYAIDRYEIAYAPSATLLSLDPLSKEGNSLKPQYRDEGSPEVVVVGVASPDIPAVETEVLTVAKNFSSKQLLLDEEATIDAFVSATQESRMLHVACHGLFRHDNPMFSALKLHDGWFTAADAAGLDLTDALVTLSACESGRGRILGGDESIGLVRAFLGAGAATVVVSQWLVQDDVTATLMTNFYTSLMQHKNPAKALRAAQLVVKAEYPHPYYWAPFVTIGRLLP